VNEIVRFEFEGQPLEFQKLEGEWWANAEEAADILGYADRRKILNLFGRHEEEFLPSETCVLTSRTQPGQVRAVRFFSPKGLEHLAILGRTEKCVRFRRWLLDEVLEKLRDGGRLVTADQVERLLRRLAMLEGQIVLLRDREQRLAHIIDIRVSASGRELNAYRRTPEIAALAAEHRRRQEKGRGQRFLFEGLEGEAALTALKARILDAISVETASGGPLRYSNRGIARPSGPRDVSCVRPSPRCWSRGRSASTAGSSACPPAASSAASRSPRPTSVCPRRRPRTATGRTRSPGCRRDAPWRSGPI